MKKFILTLIIFGLTASFTFAQSVINDSIITMIGSKNFTFENDTLEVTFLPSEYAWNIKIKNKLNEDIGVIWEKSTFILNGAASKVIFDNTLKMNKDNAIPDQEVPSDSFISKNIFPSGNFVKKYSTPTVSKKDIKKSYEETGKPETVKIALMIKVKGELKKYDFNFEMTPKLKK